MKRYLLQEKEGKRKILRKIRIVILMKRKIRRRKIYIKIIRFPKAPDNYAQVRIMGKRETKSEYNGVCIAMAFE